MYQATFTPGNDLNQFQENGSMVATTRAQMCICIITQLCKYSFEKLLKSCPTDQDLCSFEGLGS